MYALSLSSNLLCKVIDDKSKLLHKSMVIVFISPVFSELIVKFVLPIPVLISMMSNDASAKYNWPEPSTLKNFPEESVPSL